MSLIIRGEPENKNGLALGKGFKIARFQARIIHDTNEFPLSNLARFKHKLR